MCVWFFYTSVFIFAVLLRGGSRLVKLLVYSPALLLEISFVPLHFSAVCFKVKVEAVGSYKYLRLVLGQQYRPSLRELSKHSVFPQEATIIQQL